jgi:hypothetical protein
MKYPMLKKIALFTLVGLVVVACSSDNDKEKKKKERNYQETVYAFINSNPRIAGFGRLDVDAIMKDGEVTSNEAFKSFVSDEYNEIKSQVDVTAPVYFAVEAPENDEAVGYVMIKLKDQKKFVEDWTASGYIFKEHKKITYTEDGDYLWGLKNETLLLVITPGEYDSKKVIAEAFQFTEGKMATAALKKQIDAPGDMIMHFDVEKLTQNEPNRDVDVKGMEADLSLNFDKGKMIIEATSNKTEELKKQLGLEVQDKPIMAKKITDAEGNVVVAMQVSLANKMLELAVANDADVAGTMNDVAGALMMIDPSLQLLDIEEGEVIPMPESGRNLGELPMEMMIDFDPIVSLMPMFQDYLKDLDYAVYEMNDTSVRVVIATHDKNKNFLATALSVAESFVMSGAWMR